MFQRQVESKSPSPAGEFRCKAPIIFEAHVTIYIEIESSMPTTTPKKIDAVILKFCASINAHARPIYVNLIPKDYAEPRECFQNVKNHIAQNGGRIAFGWKVQTWPTIYMEAECHAVWETPEDGFIDITPTQDHENKVLFIQDDFAVYDFSEHTRRDNKRLALTNDKKVLDFLAISAEIFRFEELHSCGKQFKLVGPDVGIYTHLTKRKEDLLLAIYKRFLGRNDPCTCGSGIKVKKCCGLDRAINTVTTESPGKST